MTKANPKPKNGDSETVCADEFFQPVRLAISG